MMAVIPQTRAEKIAMYMKVGKREIIEMLLTNQELVAEYLLRSQQPALGMPQGRVCPAGVVCNNPCCPRHTSGPQWSANNSFQGNMS